MDLGGGTGNFWEEYPPDHRRVLCVDSSREMLMKAVEQRRVEPMLADAAGFATLPPSQIVYDRVLLKELVHHLPPEQIRPM